MYVVDVACWFHIILACSAYMVQWVVTFSCTEYTRVFLTISYESCVMPELELVVGCWSKDYVMYLTRCMIMSLLHDTVLFLLFSITQDIQFHSLNSNIKITSCFILLLFQDNYLFMVFRFKLRLYSMCYYVVPNKYQNIF